MSVFRRKPKLTSVTVVVVSPETGRVMLEPLGKQRQYRAALEMVDHINPSGTELILGTIEFMLDVVKRDLQGDYLTRVLYGGSEVITELFPAGKGHLDIFEVAGNIGEKLEADRNNRVTVNLADDFVFARPWSRSRLVRAVSTIKKESFEYDDQNHNGWYYKNMGYGWIVSGHHSISAGTHAKQGTIQLPIVDEEILFSRIMTDGAYWIDSAGMEVLGETLDFRFALIYEFTRRRYELLNQSLG